MKEGKWGTREEEKNPSAKAPFFPSFFALGRGSWGEGSLHLRKGEPFFFFFFCKGGSFFFFFLKYLFVFFLPARNSLSLPPAFRSPIFSKRRKKGKKVKLAAFDPPLLSCLLLQLQISRLCKYGSLLGGSNFSSPPSVPLRFLF